MALEARVGRKKMGGSGGQAEGNGNVCARRLFVTPNSDDIPSPLPVLSLTLCTRLFRGMPPLCVATEVL